MVIEVLGPGCSNCNKLFALVEQAVKELQLDAKVKKIEDINIIVGYGVLRTPAVAVDGVVRISGRVPELEEIKVLLQGGP